MHIASHRCAEELKTELEREVLKLRNEFLADQLDAARSTQKIRRCRARSLWGHSGLCPDLPLAQPEKASDLRNRQVAVFEISLRELECDCSCQADGRYPGRLLFVRRRNYRFKTADVRLAASGARASLQHIYQQFVEMW
jgi:hypothetical protein